MTRVETENTSEKQGGKCEAEVIKLSKQARRLFREHRYAEARDLYRQGLELNAENPYLLSGLGDACRELGEMAEAGDCYQRLLDLEPDNLFALRGLGDLYKKEQRHPQAIELWQRYLALRPNDLHVMTRIADSCKVLERYDEAQAGYQQALAADPMDRYALTGLADLHHRRGQDREAIACYEKVLTLRHDLLHILTIVGKLCWRVSDFDKAESFFKRALRIDPENPYALYGLGNCYRWRREYHKAVVVWQRILRHNEGTVALYSRLGDAFTNLGDFSSAEQAYRQVLERSYDRYSQIGMVKLCCDRGDYQEALHGFERLCQEEENPRLQLEDLSKRFVRSGRRQQMIEFFHYLLERQEQLSIDTDRVRELLQRLEQGQ